MTITEKYIEALKTLNEFVPVSVWVERFAQMYPKNWMEISSSSLERDIIGWAIPQYHIG